MFCDLGEAGGTDHLLIYDLVWRSGMASVVVFWCGFRKSEPATTRWSVAIPHFSGGNEGVSDTSHQNYVRSTDYKLNVFFNFNMRITLDDLCVSLWLRRYMGHMHWVCVETCACQKRSAKIDAHVKSLVYIFLFIYTNNEINLHAGKTWMSVRAPLHTPSYTGLISTRSIFGNYKDKNNNER
jgi:hypothetical protein